MVFSQGQASPWVNRTLDQVQLEKLSLRRGENYILQCDGAEFLLLISLVDNVLIQVIVVPFNVSGIAFIALMTSKHVEVGADDAPEGGLEILSELPTFVFSCGTFLPCLSKSSRWQFSPHAYSPPAFGIRTIDKGLICVMQIVAVGGYGIGQTWFLKKHHRVRAKHIHFVHGSSSLSRYVRQVLPRWTFVLRVEKPHVPPSDGVDLADKSPSRAQTHVHGLCVHDSYDSSDLELSILDRRLSTDTWSVCKSTGIQQQLHHQVDSDFTLHSVPSLPLKGVSGGTFGYVRSLNLLYSRFCHKDHLHTHTSVNVMIWPCSIFLSQLFLFLFFLVCYHL